jgi:hypothetical protein
MDNMTDGDGLLGAAKESCRAGRLGEARSLPDQWAIRSPKSVIFRAGIIQGFIEFVDHG